MSKHIAPPPQNVIILLPILHVGGTEVQTLSVIRVLAEVGYRITVCCYYEFDEHVVVQFEQAGACIVLLRMQRSEGLLALLLRLRKFFREEQPDIVHVQYLAPGLIPIIAARLAGVKTVLATVHIAGTVAYGRKAKLLLRLAARLCTSFICVSRGVEQFWFGDSMVLVPGKIDRDRRHVTIYNAVDCDRIKAVVTATDSRLLHRELEIRPESQVIGIVGRLAEQKGHAFLLDAFKEVVTQFPYAILLIVGDGPLRQQLEEQAHRLGVDSSIRWMGSQRQEDVFRFYAVMNIFAMPSLFEGFGLTAAEAMAAGLPVVASDVDGLAEVVADGETGLLVPQQDTAALAAALIELLESPEKVAEMGFKGRQRVEKCFSLQRFSECTLAAYEAFKR